MTLKELTKIAPAVAKEAEKRDFCDLVEYCAFSNVSLPVCAFPDKWRYLFAPKFKALRKGIFVYDRVNVGWRLERDLAKTMKEMLGLNGWGKLLERNQAWN